MDAWEDSRTLFHVKGQFHRSEKVTFAPNILVRGVRALLVVINYLDAGNTHKYGSTDKNAFTAWTTPWLLIKCYAINLTSLGWATTSRKRKNVGGLKLSHLRGGAQEGLHKAQLV